MLKYPGTQVQDHCLKCHLPNDNIVYLTAIPGFLIILGLFLAVHCRSTRNANGVALDPAFPPKGGVVSSGKTDDLASSPTLTCGASSKLDDRHDLVQVQVTKPIACEVCPQSADSSCSPGAACICTARRRRPPSHRKPGLRGDDISPSNWQPGLRGDGSGGFCSASQSGESGQPGCDGPISAGGCVVSRGGSGCFSLLTAEPGRRPGYGYAYSLGFAAEGRRTGR